MRIGVYVDAYNLYYGGRGHCGRSTRGWKWLDVRAVAEAYAGWAGSKIERLVYCTARVNRADSPSASLDQDIYIKALRHQGAVTHIEEGRYVAWVRREALVEVGAKGSAPALYHAAGDEKLDPRLPLQVEADRETGMPIVLASVRRREEKGSDVNVASQLLHDVPTGTINPGAGPLAGALRGGPNDGVGRHWWRQLQPADFTEHQLPDPVGPYRKPDDW